MVQENRDHTQADIVVLISNKVDFKQRLVGGTRHIE